MARFLVLGHGGTPPATQQEQEAWMGRWMVWFGEVKEHLVDPGAPFSARRALGVVPEATAANGYMLLEAADLDAAVELVRSCPAMQDGSGMEVIELVPVPGSGA